MSTAPDAPRPRDDAAHADDPAAPLEAYLEAIARLLGDHDDDPTVPVGMTLTATGGEHGYGRVTLTVGDLRKAVAAIRVLTLQFHLLRGFAYREPPGDSPDGDGDGVTWKEEAERLRAERDAALRMFAKAKWRGPWTLTPAEWVSLGRKMAGLKAEGEPPAGGTGEAAS